MLKFLFYIYRRFHRIWWAHGINNELFENLLLCKENEPEANISFPDNTLTLNCQPDIKRAKVFKLTSNPIHIIQKPSASQADCHLHFTVSPGSWMLFTITDYSNDVSFLNSDLDHANMNGSVTLFALITSSIYYCPYNGWRNGCSFFSQKAQQFCHPLCR